jgi:hypothetical protein
VEDAEVAHEAFMHAYELALPTGLRQDLRVPGIQQFAAAVGRAAPAPAPAPAPALTDAAAAPRRQQAPQAAALAPAQVWERRRSIPSQTYNDPLDHIFTEFDTDDDDRLTAGEVAAALRSRGVDADEALMQRFVEGAPPPAVAPAPPALWRLSPQPAARQPGAARPADAAVPRLPPPPQPPTPNPQPPTVPAAVNHSGSHDLARHQFADFVLHLAAADLRNQGAPDAKTLLEHPDMLQH